MVMNYTFTHRTHCFLFLFIYAISYVQLMAQTEEGTVQLQTILNETADDLSIRAQKLEAFAASHRSTEHALDALLLAARARLSIESSSDNQIAQADLQQVIKIAPGTWRDTVATASLIGAYHQDGKHEMVVSLSERALMGAPSNILRLAEPTMSKLVKSALQIDPTTFEDGIRAALAIGYKRLGRDRDATQVHAQIKDVQLRSALANEIGVPQEKSSKSRSAPLPPIESPGSEAPKSPPNQTMPPATNQTANQPQPSENKSWLVWLLIVIAATVGAAWLFLRKSK